MSLDEPDEIEVGCGDSLNPASGNGAGHGPSGILLVDDDDEMRNLLRDVLGDEGYEVFEATNGAEALLWLHRQSFAAIVLDKNMPGLSGLDLLPGIRTVCPRTPVILITAFGDMATYQEARDKGAFEYLFKPFGMEEILQVLRNALVQQESPTGSRESER
jgi:DNA-binding NtrC family response regulator